MCIRYICWIFIMITILTSCGKEHEDAKETDNTTSVLKETSSTTEIASDAETVTTKEEATITGAEEKSIIQQAIEGKKFYFVSPQSGDVEEYIFKDNGNVEFNEYYDTDGKIHKIDTNYTFTYAINDKNNTITLTKSYDNERKDIIYYYNEQYNYFRTEVIPSDENDPDGMPPQFWASGFFPYDYNGNSGEIYKYWYDVISPTFYKDYITQNTSEANEDSEEISVTGMYGVSFKVPSGFEDVSPAEVAMKYYYEYYNSDLDMTIGIGEHLKINIPSTLEEDYDYYCSAYSDSISYNDIGSTWYVISGTDENGYIFYIKTNIYADTYTSINIRYPESNKDKCDNILEYFLRNFTCE